MRKDMPRICDELIATVVCRVLLLDISTCLKWLEANMPLRGKQKSKLQKSASLKGLQAIHGNKENSASRSLLVSGGSVLDVLLLASKPVSIISNANYIMSVES